MQPGKRIVLAAVILVFGLAVAMLFRRAPSSETGRAPLESGSWRMRSPVEQPALPARPAPAAVEGSPVPRAQPLVERTERLPELAARQPGFSDSILANAVQPRLAPPRPIRHKVKDGDSLGSLARRYLGSPDRAGEIYAANRELLPNPELLPIGGELIIPLSAARP